MKKQFPWQPLFLCMLVFLFFTGNGYCAKKDFDRDMTISPSSPRDSWTTPSLAQNVTATLFLTVVETGYDQSQTTKYTLESGPKVDHRGTHVLWNGTVQKGLSTLRILNTAQLPSEETLIVVCRWKENRTGGGSGGSGTGGNNLNYIDGEARGIAKLNTTNVSWQFNKTKEISGGQFKIQFTADFTGSNGEPTTVSVTSITAPGSHSSGAIWNITPSSQNQTSQLSGEVSCDIPSSSAIQIIYNGQTVSSDDILFFNEVTLQLSESTLWYFDDGLGDPQHPTHMFASVVGETNGRSSFLIQAVVLSSCPTMRTV